MERAILVTVQLHVKSTWSAEDLSRELYELASSCGVKVIEEMICRIDKPNSTHFIGKGKAEEISELCIEKGANVVIFNNDLSSTQQRNLEQIINTKTIDRTQLILDIFARHAKSLEGKIQVELAQLEYLLPRLTGKGVILSRLGGGIGTRGPGEQKLEVDRRRIRNKITRLKKELASLRIRRTASRKKRKVKALTSIAIIGYTNAGKSTLLNFLTNSNELVMDKMFATLDPVVRRFVMPNKQKVIFSDTVGFLNKLPHHLIESFKATMEEVVEADILLHVLDISHPKVYEHRDAVYEVLEEIKARNLPMITALNKVDLVKNEFAVARFQRDFENSVVVSALNGWGMDKLIDKITGFLSELITEVKVKIPQNKFKLVSLIYDEGEVIKKEYRGSEVYIEAIVPLRIKKILEDKLNS